MPDNPDYLKPQERKPIEQIEGEGPGEVSAAERIQTQAPRSSYEHESSERQIRSLGFPDVQIAQEVPRITSVQVVEGHLYKTNPQSAGVAQSYNLVPAMLYKVREETVVPTLDNKASVAKPGDFLLAITQQNGEMRGRAFTAAELNKLAGQGDLRLPPAGQEVWNGSAPGQILQRDGRGRYLISTGVHSEQVPVPSSRQQELKTEAWPITYPRDVKNGPRGLYADNHGNVYQKNLGQFELMPSLKEIPISDVLKGPQFRVGDRVPVGGSLSPVQHVLNSERGPIAIVADSSKAPRGDSPTILQNNNNPAEMARKWPRFERNGQSMTVNPATGDVFQLRPELSGPPRFLDPQPDLVGLSLDKAAEAWRQHAVDQVSMDTAEIDTALIQEKETARPQERVERVLHEIVVDGKRVTLTPDKGEAKVGRYSSSDLKLNSENVSREHGRFFYDQQTGKLSFQNLSKQTERINGTWVVEETYGRRIERPLKANEVVRLDHVKELHIGGIEGQNGHRVQCKEIKPGASAGESPPPRLVKGRAPGLDFSVASSGPPEVAGGQVDFTPVANGEVNVSTESNRASQRRETLAEELKDLENLREKVKSEKGLTAQERADALKVLDMAESGDAAARERVVKSVRELKAHERGFGKKLGGALGAGLIVLSLSEWYANHCLQKSQQPYTPRARVN